MRKLDIEISRTEYTNITVDVPDSFTNEEIYGGLHNSKIVKHIKDNKVFWEKGHPEDITVESIEECGEGMSSKPL